LDFLSLLKSVAIFCSLQVVHVIVSILL
jgi:hypothetical protein